MSKQLTKPTGTKSVVQFFEQDAVKSKFEAMMGKNAPQFITSVLQVVNSNGLLANCDPVTIYTAAATAATLNLPINNNLGFSYIVPYKTKQKDGSYKDVAQFQLGYKGFIQLALRSGQFEDLGACAVHEGQISEENPLEGFKFDWKAKTSDKVVGYVAFFKLLNGFKKYYYMSVEDLRKHGKQYSKTYDQQYGQWQKNFDGMATKTVLKQLLSKYAPLSVEMQQAVTVDQSVVKDPETLEVEYIDNAETQEVMEDNRAELLINDCATVEELEALSKELPPFYKDDIEAKRKELTK